MSCLSFSDTGSSSSEDEAPPRPTSGSGARNGEVRRRRSRTPSPRRRHRDVSPRSDSHSNRLNFMRWDMFCIVHIMVSVRTPSGKDVLHLLDADGAPLHHHDAADLLPLDEGILIFVEQ